LAELAEQIRLSLTVRGLNDPNVPPVTSEELSEGFVFVRSSGAQTIFGSALIKDIFGQPALWLQIELARSIYNQGQSSLSYFLLSLLILGSVFAAATILLLERVVLSRLAYLHERVVNIPNDRELSTRIELQGKDELSSLANAMNTTFESLAHTQERLKQARDHALDASRAKAQILANVSHDARTPISVILLRTEMLKKELYGPITEKQSSMLDSVLANARQLLGFISNLLDGAQLESGKLQLHKHTFSPLSLLQSINDAYLPLANHKGLSLIGGVEPVVPTELYGDPDRLTQILFNLVGNAIKFTLSGSVSVRIYLYDSMRWAMEVTDTGVGISPEHQGRIFESFWQVDGTSTRLATSGVGLGLSIVKQLTTMMGGFVEVKSEVEAGSVFTVVIPIERVQGEPDARAEVRLDN
jgi:signal transduction histidine kinase